jgi:hypothetical protein
MIARYRAVVLAFVVVGMACSVAAAQRLPDRGRAEPGAMRSYFRETTPPKNVGYYKLRQVRPPAGVEFTIVEVLPPKATWFHMVRIVPTQPGRFRAFDAPLRRPVLTSPKRP